MQSCKNIYYALYPSRFYLAVDLGLCMVSRNHTVEVSRPIQPIHSHHADNQRVSDGASEGVTLFGSGFVLQYGG